VPETYLQFWYGKIWGGLGLGWGSGGYIFCTSYMIGWYWGRLYGCTIPVGECGNLCNGAVFWNCGRRLLSFLCLVLGFVDTEPVANDGMLSCTIVALWLRDELFVLDDNCIFSSKSAFGPWRPNPITTSVSLFHKDDIFLLLLLSISAHRHLIDDYVPCMRGWGKTFFW
jgi:hypothetical protein